MNQARRANKTTSGQQRWADARPGHWLLETMMSDEGWPTFH